MASTRARPNCSRILALALMLTILTGGCVIGRVYVGSEIPAELQDKIAVGATTKSEILRLYGPPDTVRRQYDGDLFVYQFLRRNFSSLNITEPVFTHLTIFSYSRVQQKDDSLVILFDKDGVVKNFGYHRGTSEMTPF
jgi:outer membrane protein assembly factor BamE (lipoprotein component of BamABCDE complex)